MSGWVRTEMWHLGVEGTRAAILLEADPDTVLSHLARPSTRSASTESKIALNAVASPTIAS